MTQVLKGFVQYEYGLRCPTEVCGAVCCKAMSFRPDKHGPCEYLESDLTCELQNVGGPPCKPKGCVDYPRDQKDIDGLNKQLVEFGFEKRCLLYFEDGD